MCLSVGNTALEWDSVGQCRITALGQLMYGSPKANASLQQHANNKSSPSRFSAAMQLQVLTVMMPCPFIIFTEVL